MVANKFIESQKSRTAEALVSIGNSSSVPLNIGEHFYGSNDDVFAYSSCSINIFTDQAGTVEIQQSSDAVHWDIKTPFYVVANQSEYHATTILARYVRIHYINGNFAQTIFRLQCLFHMYRGVDTSMVSALAPISEDNDTSLVRIANDVHLDLALGRFENRKQMKIYGYSDKIHDVVSMVKDDIGEHVFLTTAKKLRAKGGNANDSNDGTHARKILVYGLNDQWDAYEEEINLNGEVPSELTDGHFIRVFGAKVISSGSYHSLSFDDIIVETEDGEVQAVIKADVGESKKCLYTVPRGKKCFVKNVYVGLSFDKLAICYLYINENANIIIPPFGVKKCIYKWQSQSTANQIIELDYGAVLQEYTDIWIACKSEESEIENINSFITLLEVDMRI